MNKVRRQLSKQDLGMGLEVFYMIICIGNKDFILYIGNKGAIIIFLKFHSTWLCLINCHIAAGEGKKL
jgi:hypothetical protein